MIALFKNEVISITIETNLFEADFLDVNFNLATGKFFPFRKPNNQPQRGYQRGFYINAKSNHPPNILREYHITVKSIKELRSNYAAICSNVY